MPEYKILFLAPSFKLRGGVSVFCEVFLDNLGSDFYVDHLETGNRLGNESFLRRFFYLICAAYRLVARLRNTNYDVIQVNPSFVIYSLLRDSLYLWIINIFNYGGRAVVFFHGWNVDLAQRIVESSFYRSIFGGIYRHAGAIFVLHKLCKDQLVDMGISPEKIMVTTTTYKRIADESKEYPSKKTDGKIIILFMSRILKDKGVDTTVEVAKLLVKNGYSDFHLVFAGDGPFLSELKKLIVENGLDEHVDVLGYVSGMEKEEILRKGDIFILPTRLQEGCPVSIMEAMGAGHAILSTNRGAIPEVIENGRNGFICDGKDGSMFYEAVKELLHDRELLSNMQKANKKKAEEKYEIKGYIRRMEEVYLSIINNTPIDQV